MLSEYNSLCLGSPTFWGRGTNFVEDKLGWFQDD